MRSNSPQIRLKTTLQLVCLIWLLICAVITARDLDWTIDRGTRRGTAPFMTEQRRKELKAMAKRMFYHGFDNYMEHAFPMDELDPIKCQGRGPDYATPSNIAINDVLGNYSVTLVDVLDTLVVSISNYRDLTDSNRSSEIVQDLKKLSVTSCITSLSIPMPRFRYSNPRSESLAGYYQATCSLRLLSMGLPSMATTMSCSC